MTIRCEMAQWRATSARSETRVTREICPRQSRPSRLSWTPYHIPTPIQTYE